jgi:hypothetical protein
MAIDDGPDSIKIGMAGPSTDEDDMKIPVDE